MNKKGAEWWELMAIILAVAGLIVAILIIINLKSQTGSFLNWLKWTR